MYIYVCVGVHMFVYMCVITYYYIRYIRFRYDKYLLFRFDCIRCATRRSIMSRHKDYISDGDFSAHADSFDINIFRYLYMKKRVIWRIHTIQLTYYLSLRIEITACIVSIC
ncbi:hypothetical protein FKM82_023304 [Ascaphus truei]